MEQNYYEVPYELEKIDIDKFDVLISSIPDKMPVIIYGAGKHGRLICEYLTGLDIKVPCFCDRSEEKQAGLYYGKPVISPHELYAQADRKIIIVAAFNYQNEIKQTLIENGVNPKSIVLPSYKVIKGNICVPKDAMPEECKRDYALVTKSISENQFKEAPINPQITVCTRVYNVPESYLRRAIESVLNQTFRNFRYLIIDNGSTDGSADIIKEYEAKDKRIEVITRETNRTGISLGQDDCARQYRREFFNKLNTVYFCVLDSDDYLDEDFLKVTYGSAKEHDADIVAICSLIHRESDPKIYESSSSPLNVRAFNDDKQKLDALLNHMFIWRVVWGKLMKTEIYLKGAQIGSSDVRSNETIRNIIGNARDTYIMFRRLAISKTIVMCDKILHFHTAREKSSSRSLTEQSKPFIRVYYLNNWLVEQVHKSDAINAKNMDLITDFSLSVIYGLDLPLLEESKRERADLVINEINGIIEADMPENLKKSKKMNEAICKLHEILEDAKKHMQEGAAS